MARWAARKSDLYPKDDIGQLVVDEALEAANEMVSKCPFTESDPAVKKSKREEWANKVVPPYMNLFTKRIEKSGGPFLLGKSISIADLFIYSQLQMVYSGLLDHVDKDIIEKNFPTVHKLYVAVHEHPIAKAEMEAYAH